MANRMEKPDQSQRDHMESDSGTLVKWWFLELRESREILRWEHCVAHHYFPLCYVQLLYNMEAIPIAEGQNQLFLSLLRNFVVQLIHVSSLCLSYPFLCRSFIYTFINFIKIAILFKPCVKNIDLVLDTHKVKSWSCCQILKYCCQIFKDHRQTS